MSAWAAATKAKTQTTLLAKRPNTVRSEERRLFSQAKHRLYNSTIQLEQFVLNHYPFKRVSRLAITF